jgi:hypothetical protein
MLVFIVSQDHYTEQRNDLIFNCYVWLWFPIQEMLKVNIN